MKVNVFLIRFETTKQPVWFKAVGKPNAHEYVIAQALAQLLRAMCQTFWPRSRMARLALSNPGITLGRHKAPPVPDRCKESWQISSSNLFSDKLLLDANCRTCATALLEQVDPFFETVPNYVQQTRIPHRSLLARTRRPARNSQRRPALFASTQIPDSLGTLISTCEHYCGRNVVSFWTGRSPHRHPS